MSKDFEFIVENIYVENSYREFNLNMKSATFIVQVFCGAITECFASVFVRSTKQFSVLFFRPINRVTFLMPNCFSVPIGLFQGHSNYERSQR